ncbi:MAG: NRDE family protein [Planctomycetaceae bacterium]|jgi:uncharacterized protein with NRDE domain|nr:NRDE family protein [Planctomycetaceae bacterium]
MSNSDSGFTFAVFLIKYRQVMGIIAVYYKKLPDAPLLVAMNREEDPARESLSPKIQSGRPRSVCGVDQRFGGTWAGVNQHGLFVAVANCTKKAISADPRSRGLLCRELLGCQNAEEALDMAQHELLTGCYAGANFVCVDRTSGGVVHGGDDIDIVKLTPGLHIVTENRVDNINDYRQEFARRLLTLQRIDSAISFFAIASKTFSSHPDTAGKMGILVNKPNRKTVSSMLISLTEKTPRSVMQYAAGSPDVCPYEDVSALLRQVLSTDRAARAAAAAKEAKAKAAELGQR